MQTCRFIETFKYLRNIIRVDDKSSSWNIEGVQMTAYNDCVSDDGGIIVVTGLKKCYASCDENDIFMGSRDQWHEKRDANAVMDLAESNEGTLPDFIPCLRIPIGGSGKSRERGRTYGFSGEFMQMCNFETGSVYLDSLATGIPGAQQNVTLFRYSIQGVDFSAIVQDLLCLTGLAGRKYQKYHSHSELSGGQRKGVIFNRLMVYVPSFILPYESEKTLTSKTTGEIMGIIPYFPAKSKSGAQADFLKSGRYQTIILCLSPSWAFKSETTEMQVTNENIGYGFEHVASLKTIPPFLQFRSSPHNMTMELTPALINSSMHGFQSSENNVQMYTEKTDYIDQLPDNSSAYERDFVPASGMITADSRSGGYIAPIACQG